MAKQKQNSNENRRIKRARVENGSAFVIYIM